MPTIIKQTFDLVANDSLTITAGATEKLNIVGLIIIADGDAGETNIATPHMPITNWLYGTSQFVGIVLDGDGGSWGLPISRDSVNFPYWTGANSDDFWITNSAGAGRIAGAVWYYIT